MIFRAPPGTARRPQGPRRGDREAGAVGETADVSPSTASSYRVPRFVTSIFATGTPVTRIEVTKRGTRYELAVNGETVGGFTDGTGLAVTHLGVFVDDAQSVVFRKIIVTAP